MKRVLLGMVMCVAACGLPAVAKAQDNVGRLQDLVGVEKGDGGYQMQQRGYRYVRTERAGDNSWDYWREPRTNRCVTVRVADNRYRSIVYAHELDCKGSADDNWGGSGSSGSSGWGQGSSGSQGKGVTLHRDLSFQGMSETFTNDVPDMRRTRFGDDQATSVSISRGCTARLYRDLNFQGGYTEVTGDMADLRGSRVGDDSVTSLQVRCGGHGWGGSGWGGGGDDWGDEDRNKPYGVTLHRDLNYTGISETFTGDVPDLRGSRVGDDSTTSVSVSSQCRARLYQNPNYEGAYTEVNGDIGDLRGSRVGDDSVTSIRVRCDRYR